VSDGKRNVIKCDQFSLLDADTKVYNMSLMDWDVDSGALSDDVVTDNGDKLEKDDILINLQIEHPPFFSRFRYLAELVSNDEADKAAARLKFKFYRDRGYEIKSTDVSKLK
jgi:hypothetical protein